MELFFTIIVYMLFGSMFLSFVFYTFTAISLIQTVRGKNKKKKGIIFLVLGTLFAYVPLKHLLGISITNKGMLLLFLIDCIMIYVFLKH